MPDVVLKFLRSTVIVVKSLKNQASLMICKEVISKLMKKEAFSSQVTEATLSLPMARDKS
tara:strand:+ start:39 stop:218 length:180 start_codon:yes stop_codon:yes gene_type:complete